METARRTVETGKRGPRSDQRGRNSGTGTTTASRRPAGVAAEAVRGEEVMIWALRRKTKARKAYA